MDLMDFSWRATGQNVLVPQILISFKFVDSNNQTQLIEDNTESSGKEVLFPNIVAQLTAEEKHQLMDCIVKELINIKRQRLGV
jgi:hypothetical protein